MKYRDHRGGLKESMETVREVNSAEEIIEHLNGIYKQNHKEIEEVKFKYCSYDKRIDWDTYYVLQRLKGEKDFTVAGMSDGIFDKTE